MTTDRIFSGGFKEPVWQTDSSLSQVDFSADHDPDVRLCYPRSLVGCWALLGLWDMLV